MEFLKQKKKRTKNRNPLSATCYQGSNWHSTDFCRVALWLLMSSAIWNLNPGFWFCFFIYCWFQSDLWAGFGIQSKVVFSWAFLTYIFYFLLVLFYALSFWGKSQEGSVLLRFDGELHFIGCCWFFFSSMSRAWMFATVSLILVSSVWRIFFGRFNGFSAGG